MRKKIIMWLSFITAFSLILHSCRNEDFSINEKSEHKNPLSSKVIHYEDLKKHKAAFDELIKITKSSHDSQTSKLYVDEENGFTVDLDDCLFVEDPEGQKSYTFKITEIDPKNNNPDILENLVLVEKGENLFESYIFQYERDVQLNYFKSEEDLIQNLKQKVKIFGLGEKRDIVLNSKIALCVGVTATYVEQPGTACLSGQHTYEDGSACEYWGTTDMALPGYGGHFVYTFDAADCYGGGGGNPSSGSGTTGPYHGGGGGTGAINNPCAKIQNWLMNTKFKEKFNNLTKTTPTNVFDLDRELVAYMRYPPVGTNTPPAFVDIDLPACATDGNLPSFEEGMGGMMHTHNNESCSGGTPIKVPSPTDIKTFINTLLREAMQYTGSYINAYSLVATSGGNYMLMYTGTNYPGSINYDQWEVLNNDYKNAYENLYENNSNITQADIEKVFTKFMKEKINKPGLEVYRVSSTSKVKIEYDPNSPNSVKQTPCP